MTIALPLNIIATGKALPNQCVTSADLDMRFGKVAGYHAQKSGILHRYHADHSLKQSTLAADALLDACNRGGLNLNNIDLLIHVNGVPEQALPCTAAHIIAYLNWHGVAGYDLNASCVGFLPALQHAACLLNMGMYHTIAITACDLASRGLDWQDEASALIFGDGAAAAIVQRGDHHSGIDRFLIRTYPEGVHDCQIRAGGTAVNPTVGMEESDFYFRMHGHRVYKRNAEVLPDFLAKLLGSTPIADVDLWLVHQASHLAMSHMNKRLGIAADKIINIYPTHGNQVAASLPTVLHEAYTTGRWHTASTTVMIGTAAGLSVAGLIWRQQIRQKDAP